jgi:hypothetical protein
LSIIGSKYRSIDGETMTTDSSSANRLIEIGIALSLQKKTRRS